MEFQRKFGGYHRYDRRVAAARRTAATRNAPQVVINAVRRAVMDPVHAALDDLMK